MLAEGESLSGKEKNSCFLNTGFDENGKLPRPLLMSRQLQASTSSMIPVLLEPWIGTSMETSICG